MRRAIVIATFLAVALPAAALPAPAEGAAGGGAQSAVEPDARWLPWMGCWRLGEEQFEQAADGSELPGPMYVCLSPVAEGARMTARAGDEIFVDRTLVADGVRREVSDGECRGWERREWSADGRRLFTSAEIRCGDDDAPIARSGMSLLSTPSTWVDIQVVEVEGQQHLEIRRYNPAPLAETGTDASAVRIDDVRQARRESAVPPGLAAVREAAAAADPRVVEAMLTETEPRLQIDRDTLVELDDAGIDSGVIDLLVALAYPQRFVVERRRSGSSGGGWSSTGGGFAYDPFSYGAAYPYYMTPFGYYGYMRYGGLYGAYSPYYGSPFYGGGGYPFIELGGDQAPRGGAVKGLGYTRVRERTAVENLGAAVPAGGATGGSSTARRRGGGSTPTVGSSSGGGGATRGGYRGRSGGGSSGASSGAPRGGSSSSGGGRSAVPRR